MSESYCDKCNGTTGRWDEVAIDQWYPCEACAQTRETEKCSATRSTLVATNRRLNRRCQQVERDLAVLVRSLPVAVKELHCETHRMNRAAAQMREIFMYRRKQARSWDTCWNCRFRRWFKRKLWNRFFAVRPAKTSA